MVYIAYYTELDLQNCNYVQKRRICRKNSKRLTKNFVGIFALAERLPTSGTLVVMTIITLPPRLPVMPPVEVALATLPARSRATAPTFVKFIKLS